MAVHVKVVTNSHGKVPAAFEVATVRVPGQSSVTVTVEALGVGVVLHAPALRAVHEITGAEASSTTVIV